ncbi:hypothetical protein TYRP_002079 [Tyrophagus putrescentiae]|nr:hypothetical protein TYRP_002079 [Tyrophagus putrescentiae]
MFAKPAPKRTYTSTAFNSYNGNPSAKKPKTAEKEVNEEKDEEYELMEDGLDDVLSQACEEYKSQAVEQIDAVDAQVQKEIKYDDYLKLVKKDVEKFRNRKPTTTASTAPTSNSNNECKLERLRWGIKEIEKLLPNNPRILKTTSNLSALRQQQQDSMSQEI